MNGFIGTIVSMVFLLLIFDPVEKKTARGNNIKTVGQSRWARLGQYANAMSEQRAPKPQAVAKEVIIAMAHTAVYKLNPIDRPASDDCECEDECDFGLWAKKHLASTCDKLDKYQPEVLEVERIADAFCRRINAMCDTFEVDEFKIIIL